MPAPGELTVSWWDAGWIERRSIRGGLERALPYVSGVVLDAGCGDGRHRSLLASRARLYVGCDMAPKPGVSVRADVAAMPFGDSSIDTVVSVQVLDDLPEPARFFESAARVLKPGGHLVLTAPFFWRTHDLPHDYFRFTAAGLTWLAERHGFEVVCLDPRGGFWATSGQMTSLYFWSILGRGPAKPVATAFCTFIQALALLLEGVHHDPRQTLGYSMVARKLAG